MASCIRYTLCDKVCQLLVTGQWFSQGTSVSYINKTDHHNITEILLRVALNTLNHLHLQHHELVWLLEQESNFIMKHVIHKSMLSFVEYKIIEIKIHNKVENICFF